MRSLSTRPMCSWLLWARSLDKTFRAASHAFKIQKDHSVQQRRLKRFSTGELEPHCAQIYAEIHEFTEKLISQTLYNRIVNNWFMMYKEKKNLK